MGTSWEDLGLSAKRVPWGIPHKYSPGDLQTGCPGITAEAEVDMSRGIPGCLAQGCTGAVIGAKTNMGLGLPEHFVLEVP